MYKASKVSWQNKWREIINSFQLYVVKCIGKKIASTIYII